MFKWNVKRIWRNNFVIGDGKTTTSKVKIFSLSLLLGILVSFTILAIFIGDPFTPVFKGIGNAFSSEQGVKTFLNTMGILGLGGIAVAIGFKTGLFNMGVSGQMIMGGFTTGIIAINLGDAVPNGVGQILVLFLSVLFAAMFAAIAGALKAYFRVHEVVSTILLNWIAFYFMKTMLDPSTSSIMPETGTGLFSMEIPENFLLRFNGNSMWPVFIILISTAAIIWFVVYKTSFGMKLKMTGLNSDAAKAAGVNTKAMTITSMAISGAIAGLLGAVLYFGQQNAFAVPTADVVPQTGFDGIAIALIAFSNPLLIVPVATLFSLIQTGIAFTNGHVDVIFISLVLGVLMFVSAIGSMWNRFHFNKWIRILVKGWEYNFLYEKHSERLEKIHHGSNDLFKHATSIDEKNKIMNENILLVENESKLFASQVEKALSSKLKLKDDVSKIRESVKNNSNTNLSSDIPKLKDEHKLFVESLVKQKDQVVEQKVEVKAEVVEAVVVSKKAVTKKTTAKKIATKPSTKKGVK